MFVVNAYSTTNLKVILKFLCNSKHRLALLFLCRTVQLKFPENFYYDSHFFLWYAVIDFSKVLNLLKKANVQFVVESLRMSNAIHTKPLQRNISIKVFDSITSSTNIKNLSLSKKKNRRKAFLVYSFITYVC